MIDVSNNIGSPFLGSMKVPWPSDNTPTPSIGSNIILSADSFDMKDGDYFEIRFVLRAKIYKIQLAQLATVRYEVMKLWNGSVWLVLDGTESV